MQLTLNGKKHKHRGDGRLAALLEEIGLHDRRVAIVVNGRVVPRSELAVRCAEDGDRVDVLALAGGG